MAQKWDTALYGNLILPNSMACIIMSRYKAAGMSGGFDVKMIGSKIESYE